MFAMHQSTRRRVCRTVFLAGCVAPTLLILGAAAFYATPGHRAECEARLSARLGLTVRCGRVSYPRPGTTLLSGVEFSDPETGGTVATARLIESARRDGRLLVVVSQPTVRRERLDLLCRVLHDRVLCGAGGVAGADLPIQLLMGEVTLDGSGGDETFSEVRCDVGAQRDGAQAAVRFRTVADDRSGPAPQLRLSRDRTAVPPATRLELHTGNTPLPCSLAAAWVPALDRLGDTATMRGSLWVERTADGHRGEAAGRIVGIDLDRLIGRDFARTLTGTADVTFQRAVLEQGRIVEAAGSIAAGPGVAERSLLLAASDSMRLPKATWLAERADPLVRYAQLSAAFRIDARGLALAGQCDGPLSGVVVAGDSGPLLGQPDADTVPVVALVRALVPESRVQVPMTVQTDALMRLLPIPSIVTPIPATAVNPHGRITGVGGPH